VFFSIFRLGLAGNEERGRRWWVTVGSAVASGGFFWFGSPPPASFPFGCYPVFWFHFLKVH
jgi:hypothetical protein